MLVSNVGRDHFTTPNKNKSRRRAGGRTGARKGFLPQPTSEYGARTVENRAALALTKAFKGPNNKYINSVYNAIGSQITSAIPATYLLNGVAQGTSENTRVGRLTRNRWLDIDLEFAALGALGYNNTVAVRFYVVVETTALGSAIAPSQFFVDNATFTPLSQRDRTNRNASRYCVLYDSKPFVLGAPAQASGVTAPFGTGLGQPTDKFFSMHLPLEFQTDYSRNNNGTVGDIETNSLYLVCVSDTATASAVVVNGAWTLCFNDDS